MLRLATDAPEKALERPQSLPSPLERPGRARRKQSQFMRPSQNNTAPKSALSPQMRSWIDNCLVPALVREYLAGREHDESACCEGELVPQSAPTRTAIAEEGR